MFDRRITRKISQHHNSASQYEDITQRTGRAARRAAEDIIILSAGEIRSFRKCLFRCSNQQHLCWQFSLDTPWVTALAINGGAVGTVQVFYSRYSEERWAWATTSLAQQEKLRWMLFWRFAIVFVSFFACFTVTTFCCQCLVWIKFCWFILGNERWMGWLESEASDDLAQYFRGQLRCDNDRMAALSHRGWEHRSR